MKKPTKPHLPSEPQNTFESKEPVYIDDIYSRDIEITPNLVGVFIRWEHSFYDDGGSVSFYRKINVPNSNYDQEMKQYLKKKEKYNLKMEQYKIDLEKYNEFVKLNEPVRLQKHLDEKEKELAALNKQIAKLKKKIK